MIQKGVVYKGWASLVAQLVKNLPANVEDSRDSGSIPGLERSPGEGNGKPLQYSCLENSMGRGTWRATMWSCRESDTTDYAHTQKDLDINSMENS